MIVNDTLREVSEDYSYTKKLDFEYNRMRSENILEYKKIAEQKSSSHPALMDRLNRAQKREITRKILHFR